MKRGEVARILGIRPSAVQFYTDQGLIIPGIEAPKGKGTNRRYNKKNLLELAVIREMISVGIKIEEIRLILENRGEWVRPDVIESKKVFLIISDHSTPEKLETSVIIINKPNNRKGGWTSRAIDKITDTISVDMTEAKTLVILDVNKIWDGVEI